MTSPAGDDTTSGGGHGGGGTSAAELRTWLADHPGSSKHDAARALGLRPEEVTALLGDDAAVLLLDPRTRVAAFSDEEVLAGLRAAAAELGDPLSSDSYERYAQQHGSASTARVIQRFGTWNAACEAAGLQVRRRNRSYARRWTPQEMAGHVASYLDEPGSRGSYAGYDTWARRSDGAPSAQTVRNAFGGWSGAKKAGQEALASRQR